MVQLGVWLDTCKQTIPAPQVLEQLANLDAKMTYSQARSAAVEGLYHRRLTETLVFEHWHKKTHPDQPPRQQETPRPVLLHSASRMQQLGGKQQDAPARALSVMGSAAANRDSEAVAAAAAGALSEMKQWAIDQELSMMEVRICVSRGVWGLWLPT